MVSSKGFKRLYDAVSGRLGTLKGAAKALTLAAVIAASSQDCCVEDKDEDNDIDAPQQSLILSKPQTDAVVDMGWMYNIETKNPADLVSLVTEPWHNMQLDLNTLSYLPVHSGNKLVTLMAENEKGSKVSFQKFKINVQPGPYSGNPDSLKDLLYDHIQQIAPEAVLLCEDGFCPDVHSESYLVRKAEGSLRKAVDAVKLVTDAEFPAEIMPLQIHLNFDTTCKRWGFDFAGMFWDDVICVPQYDRVLEGKDATCLDPEHPEVCIYPSLYVPPEELKSAGAVTHELVHAMINYRMDGAWDETLARNISLYIMGNSYNPAPESFCTIVGGNSYNAYFRDLCSQYGWDIDLIPAFFDVVESRDQLNPITMADTKCLVDRLVSEKQSLEQGVPVEVNTYEYFCSGLNTIFNPSYDICTTYSVQDYYCGDQSPQP